MKQILTIPALMFALGVAVPTQAEGLGDLAINALSDIAGSGLATVQIYTTGQGPGGNTLIDVKQTQVADIGELKNERGVHTLNAVYAASSTLQKVEIIQNIKSDKITNERGIQRINNINITDSKLNNVKITQDFRVSEITNVKGLQQVNLVSFNHGKTIQGVTIVQVAKGRSWTNKEGVQSVNTIIQ